MLYKFIHDRSLMHADPLQIHRLIYSRRWGNLILSSLEFQKSVRSAGVTCIDLDHCFYSYLLAASQDASLIVYDIESSADILAVFKRGEAHTAEITGAMWFPFDSGIFATASKDEYVKVWDANTLKNAISWRMNLPVNCISVPRNELFHLLIAAGMDGKNIRLCDLKSGASTHTLKGHNGSIHSLDWSPRDPYMLASGSSDGMIRYWDIRKASPCLKSMDGGIIGQSRSRSHEGVVKGISFSSDGLSLVSVGSDKMIKLWDAFRGVYTGVCGTWSHANLYSSVKPIITNSSDTKRPILFLPNNKNIHEFDLWTLSNRKVHYGHYGKVNCVVADSYRTTLYSVICKSMIA